RFLAVERRPRLVLAEDVDDVERVRRRLDVREVELGNLADGLQDRAQLLAEALDLLLGEREPRQPRDVEHLFAGNGHSLNPRKIKGPFRGPCCWFRKGKPQMPTTFAACRPFWP